MKNFTKATLIFFSQFLTLPIIVFLANILFSPKIPENINNSIAYLLLFIIIVSAIFYGYYARQSIQKENVKLGGYFLILLASLSIAGSLLFGLVISSYLIHGV